MHSEKHDNNLAARLDTLSVPEFRYDAVWVGLDASLATRRRNRKVLLWSQAACFTAIIVLVWCLLPQTPVADANLAVHPALPAIKKEVVPVASPAVAPQQTAVHKPVAKKAAVEIRKASASPAGAAPVANAVVLLPDTVTASAPAVVAKPAAPAASRFRIAHINDNMPPPAPPVAEVQPDERGVLSFLLPQRGAAGPKADVEPAERKPRSSFPFYKNH